MPDLSAPTRLWYRSPARDWVQALPIGNGRLAAMVSGTVVRERIQLNEESLWEGGVTDRVNPLARDGMAKVRDLLFTGRNTEAFAEAERILMPLERNIDSYQSAGELVVDSVQAGARPGHEAWAAGDGDRSEWARNYAAYGYRRELDLATGITGSEFTYRSSAHRREVFCSAPANLLCARFGFAPGCGDVDVNLQREQDVRSRTATADGRITLTGRLTRGGMRFAIIAQVIAHGGRLAADEDCIHVRGADAVEIRLAIATSYVAPGDISADPLARCAAPLAAAARRGWDELKAEHIADHACLFDRVRLSLPASPGDALPTDQRLERARRGEDDPGLEALHFHFGRYLLIASSRPGSLPANLQGKWCHQMLAPWSSDYHTNINLQMNYWPAGPANLAECERPLFNWMRELAPHGADAARRIWGCGGWMVHHLSDIHGCAAPMDGACGIWPMGGVWLATHCWEHYRFTRDLAYLRSELWPLMRGAMEFAADFLVEAPPGSACPGRLVTAPSHSPENSFLLPDGSRSMFTYGATMDIELIAQLAGNCLAAIAELQLADDAFAVRLRDVLARLPPIRVSPTTGGIQEWIADYTEAEPGHRHVSPLFALHPGTLITRDGTPELFRAARATIDRRLANGGGHTGWSKAWLINFLARLGDGAAAHGHILGLLREKTLPNLFDDHPPFQIDGNFGACAGMTELLLQSQGEVIDLLPALPPGWPTGAVCGLRARGAITIDLAWTEGRFSGGRLVADRDGAVRVRVQGGAVRELKLTAGTAVAL